MTPHTDIQREIRHFLLGTLAEEAWQRVEKRLMTEEDFLEELALAEGELIDDYVGERLDAAERQEFERHFLLTEERRRQLRFMRALGRYADATPQAAGPAPARETTPSLGERLRAFWGGLSGAPRAGLALTCVAVIVVALWLIIPPAGPTAPDTFVALTLAAGSGDRANGPALPGVRLPLGRDALKLTLVLPAGAAPADAYRAEMLTSNGRSEAVKVDGRDERSVTVVVPEARLARGLYAIRLYAVGADKAERVVGDSYLFKVE